MKPTKNNLILKEVKTQSLNPNEKSYVIEKAGPESELKSGQTVVLGIEPDFVGGLIISNDLAVLAVD